MHLMLIISLGCLSNCITRIQAQHDDERKINIDYNSWSPIDVIDFLPHEVKINRVRSIQALGSETAENFNTNRQNKFQSAALKTAKRRVFESVSKDNKKNETTTSTFRPAYKRKTFSTTTATSTTKTLEGSALRLKTNRKSSELKSIKSQPSTRLSTQNFLTSTPTIISSTRAIVKKPTRGIYHRPKAAVKNIVNDGGDGENYPEHFKALLKNREVITQESNKSVLKKPKSFRQQSTENITKASINIKPHVSLKSRQNRTSNLEILNSTQEYFSTTELIPNKKTTLRMRPFYRPSVRKIIKTGSTLQEPPTAMSKPTQASRTLSANRIIEEESMNVNTKITDDSIKQIDRPIQEAYFPRTSAIGSSSALRFSSRFRNSDVTTKPSYHPTVPTISTTAGLDLNEIDLERWREVLPLAAELIINNDELMTQSPSQKISTVSIYGALSEILSKPTESLNFYNNKSTDRTLFSKAPSTTESTTTSTSTTTTTTISKVQNDSIKEENTGIIIDLLQKYQNESNMHIKSPNIFSLTKKGLLDSNLESQFDFSSEINSATVETPYTSTEYLITPRTASVSIHPNGHDSNRQETKKDSFENEIIDENNEKLSIVKNINSIKTQFQPTTINIPSKESDIITMSSLILTPTTMSSSTSEKITTNFIKKNFSILQELLSNKNTHLASSRMVTQYSYPTTTPMSISTTTSYHEPSTFVYTATESSISSSSVQKMITRAPTKIPSLAPIKTTIRTPNQKNSMTQTMRRTTAILRPVSSTITNSLENFTTTSKQDISTTQMSLTGPKLSTHRFMSIPSKVTLTPTVTPSTTKKKSVSIPDKEDVEFLRQLADFINRSPSTLSPRGFYSPESTTLTTKTVPSSIKVIKSTRIPTTFSDAEDLKFLNSLRNYASIINLTTERSNLANKILELALNRSSKSINDSKGSSNIRFESIKPSPFATTQTPEMMMNKIKITQENINLMSSVILENNNRGTPMKLSAQEIEKTKQMLQKDVLQYNKDIQLLSLLIGRPLKSEDVAKLATTNLGKAITNSPTQSSTSLVPAFKSLLDTEENFLQALQQIQTSPSTTTPTMMTTSRPFTRSKSQEAILAALLRQQGIGPVINGNNQIPLEKILEQLSTERSNGDVFLSFSTTVRPFSPMPPRRQPRPILDGLSWLWQTWQETAPGYQTPRQRPQKELTSLSFDDEIDQQKISETGATGDNNELNYSTGAGVPFGNTGFISAAIGVTRAVTQFLGVAFTGAGRLLQATLSGGSSASNVDGFSRL